MMLGLFLLSDTDVTERGRYKFALVSKQQLQSQKMPVALYCTAD